MTGQYLGGTVTLDATGRVATFVPGQLLAVNRLYYAYLNNPITDVAGNHLRGGQYSVLHDRVLDRYDRPNAATDEPTER